MLVLLLIIVFHDILYFNLYLVIKMAADEMYHDLYCSGGGGGGVYWRWFYMFFTFHHWQVENVEMRDFKVKVKDFTIPGNACISLWEVCVWHSDCPIQGSSHCLILISTKEVRFLRILGPGLIDEYLSL